MSYQELVVFVFGAFNVLRLVSYLPQIRCIAADRNGASAISYLTWSIWTGANASNALYAWSLLDDVWLTLINALNAFFCALVIVLTARQRRRYRRAQSRRACEA